MLSLRSLCLLFVLCLPSVVHGHETIPSNWCMRDDAPVRLVGDFNFEYIDLLKLQQQFDLSYETTELPPDLSHGVVDGWSMASRIAHEYCKMISPPGEIAMPIILYPTAFLRDGHHAQYGLESGLVGSCVICAAGK
jgi:hypothetical protein